MYEGQLISFIINMFLHCIVSDSERSVECIGFYNDVIFILCMCTQFWVENVLGSSRLKEVFF